MIIRFILCILMLPWPYFAVAQAPASYESGFSAANAHLRSAISYLRTENIDLAALEIEAFNAAWAKIPTDSPQITKSNALAFTKYVNEVASNGATALTLIDDEKTQAAGDLLKTNRIKMRKYHDVQGLDFFADCIFDATLVGQPLWKYRRPAPDLENESVRIAIARATRDYLLALRKCGGKAPDLVKTDPEFRRLIDGAVSSLEKIPAAISDKSNGTLFRYLIELRSFDRLLYFRYG